MNILLRVLRYARNLWPYYTGIIIFSMLMSLTQLATPFIIKAATDLIVRSVQSGQAEVSGAIWLAVALFVVDVLNTLFTNWGGYLGDIMGAKLKKQLSERYYTHLLELPQSYYDEELTGKIINRLDRTINEVVTFLNVFANNFFSLFLTLILSLIIILLYSWQLALLVFIIYPIFMYLTTLTSKKWQKWQQEKNLQLDIASGRFAEVVAQIRVVKSFIQEKLELAHFSERYAKTVRFTRQQSRYWHKMDISRRLVLNVVFFGIFAYLFVATSQRHFTIGEMVLLIQLINMMRFPIFNMSFIVDSAQRAIAGSRDYFSVMDIVPSVQDETGLKPIETIDPTIRFERVSFGYGDDGNVLHDVKFAIAHGEKVALVGESGGGKTTITSLLLRLYNAREGTIMLGDHDIARLPQHSLRQHIAVVFQDAALFSGTIRENIAYADINASDNAVNDAAKAANAWEFIDKLPKKFDTEIGERGIKLSGGQKQRIAIARAILKDAPILILDEATSSLDSRAESQVQEALNRLMKGRTTLIIAHRLSTIANVDRIITLKDGRVDEIGTPSELAQTSGIYAQLLALQLGMSETAREKLKNYEITS